MRELAPLTLESEDHTPIIREGSDTAPASMGVSMCCGSIRVGLPQDEAIHVWNGEAHISSLLRVDDSLLVQRLTCRTERSCRDAEVVRYSGGAGGAPSPKPPRALHTTPKQHGSPATPSTPDRLHVALVSTAEPGTLEATVQPAPISSAGWISSWTDTVATSGGICLTCRAGSCYFV